ncbi:hypothetical protein HMSSN139_48400 [Paenibacillus sp. HMSSN-139]|nr:hypothetical protein HMSSN139_48400 [Paenibacillus sp. HMSSN-139]
MMKLLIADDEALVCIGLQSMLKWEDYQIEVVGIAHNGAQAEEMIEALRPDLVITDIKMPVKTGLQVAESVRRKYGRIPLFIFLTSYEEFEYARSAIHLQAADYLVKLELTPQTLAESVRKAVTLLEDHKTVESYPNMLYRSNLHALRDKFFIRLFNQLFENKNQYLLQRDDLELDLSAPAYLVCTCRIQGPDSVPPRGDKLVALCSSTVQMAKDTLASARPCFVTSLDLRNFAIVLPLSDKDPERWMPEIEGLLHDMASVLHSYFNVNIIGAVGYAVEDPYMLHESYLAARRALPMALERQAFVFFCPKQRSRAAFPGGRRRFCVPFGHPPRLRGAGHRRLVRHDHEGDQPVRRQVRAACPGHRCGLQYFIHGHFFAGGRRKRSGADFRERAGGLPRDL